MKKRALVLLLALIMVLGATTTAFAARKGYTPEQFDAALKNGDLVQYTFKAGSLTMYSKKGVEEYVALTTGDKVIAQKAASSKDRYTKISIYSMGYDQNHEPAWYAMRTGYVLTKHILAAAK